MKRRQFFRSSLKSAIGASLIAGSMMAAPIKSGGRDKLGSILPTRPLGKTGENLTLLGVGGAHVGRMNEKSAQEFIESALEQGVRFFDNAHIYSNGKAEEHYGNYLCPNYREHVFVMTKSTAGSGPLFEEQFNLSLKRLKTDYVDLMYIHNLKSVEDVDSREREGVFDKIRELRDEGKVRFIGFSCHTDINAAIHFMNKIRDDDFICCCQTPINSVDAGDPQNSFTSQVLPRVVAKGYSHIAMKTLAGGALRGGKMNSRRTAPSEFPIPDVISFQDNFNFVLSQPITSMVSGMESVAHLRENAEIVRKFPRLDAEHKARIIGKVAAGQYYLDPLMEVYKQRG